MSTLLEEESVLELLIKPTMITTLIVLLSACSGLATWLCLNSQGLTAYNETLANIAVGIVAGFLAFMLGNSYCKSKNEKRFKDLKLRGLI